MHDCYFSYSFLIDLRGHHQPDIQQYQQEVLLLINVPIKEIYIICQCEM